ncbi:hypothetical protein [Streptomyces sp. NPDC093707]|uniref:hypothetical protein n=1 Tax=Streptomyces sp. NPDC093707 TaxID=3154984 RepID=UPI00344B0D16
MLARLPFPYLLLMAAFATFIFCFAIDKYVKIRKATVLCFAISVGCCIGMIIVGRMQYQHWSAEHMLVLYSFAWTGLTIGLLPYRKPYLKYLDEQRRGIKREKYEFPKWCPMVTVSSVIAAGLLGIILLK